MIPVSQTAIIEKNKLESDAPWILLFEIILSETEIIRLCRNTENIIFDGLTDWTKRPEKGIKFYSGIASYKKTFEIVDLHRSEDTPQKKYFIDLGKVHNMARVIVNGKDLGVLWTSPWQMNITKALQEGENKLEIKVANLWINRLIGDKFKPDDGINNGQWPDWLIEGEPRTSDRYTFSTYTYYSRESDLVPSGLLGPVMLKSIDRSKIKTSL